MVPAAVKRVSVLPSGEPASITFTVIPPETSRSPATYTRSAELRSTSQSYSLPDSIVTSPPVLSVPILFPGETLPPSLTVKAP